MSINKSWRSWSGALGLLLVVWLGLPGRSAGQPAPGLGGDDQVRVRAQPAGGQLLERRTATGWQTVWRTPERDEEEDEAGQALEWRTVRTTGRASAVRYRWSTSAWLCGGGRIWLEPEAFEPTTGRFVPLGPWLAAAPAAVLPAAATFTVPPSPLAPAARFLVRTGDPPAVAPTSAAHEPATGWGRGPAHVRGDQVTTAELDAETAPWVLELRPRAGAALPPELWLLLESHAYQVRLPDWPVDAPAWVSFPATQPTSRCLSLVLPDGVAGVLAQTRLLTQADAAGPQAIKQVVAVLGAGGEPARAAVRRLRGTGPDGLRELMPLAPAAVPPALLVEAAAATGAPAAIEFLLQRLEQAPSEQVPRYAQALPQLGDALCRGLTDQLAGREPARLGPLVTRLLSLGPVTNRCREPLIGLLAQRLLQPWPPELLLQLLGLADRLADPALRPALLTHLGHAEAEVRRAVLAALPGTLHGAADTSPGQREVIPVLLRALEEPTPALRRQALVSLARLRPAAAPEEPSRSAVVAAGLQLRHDPWPEVRVAALLALAVHADRTISVPALLEAVTQREPEVRQPALRLLVELEAAPAALELCAKLLKDPGELLELRREALRVLALAGEAGRAELRQQAAALEQQDHPEARLLVRDIALALGQPTSDPMPRPVRRSLDPLP